MNAGCCCERFHLGVSKVWCERMDMKTGDNLLQTDYVEELDTQKAPPEFTVVCPICGTSITFRKAKLKLICPISGKWITEVGWDVIKKGPSLCNLDIRSEFLWLIRDSSSAEGPSNLDIQSEFLCLSDCSLAINEAHRVQFSPDDLRRYFADMEGDNGDVVGDADDDVQDENENDDGADDGANDGADDGDDNGDDDGDDEGDGEGEGEDEDGGLIKIIPGEEELLFTTDEAGTLNGPDIHSNFRMRVLGENEDTTYDAHFVRVEINTENEVIVWQRLAGPVWNGHMRDYLRDHQNIGAVHFRKVDDEVWCIYV